MIAIEEARAKVAARVERLARDWALSADAGALAELRIALRPPSERDVLERRAEVLAWRDAWAAADAEPGATVDWTRRSWPSAGAQAVPTHVTIVSADALARFAGPASAAAWTRLRDRISTTLDRIGRSDTVLAAVRPYTTALAAYPRAEFETVLDVVDWLVANPVDGMRPRQLPVRGVDSKWFGSHRAVVTALALAASGRESLGIVGDPPLFRVRLLDADTLPEGPRAFAATIDELAVLGVRCEVVLILENLESLLSLPLMDSVIAVHGRGFAAADLAAVTWIRSSRIVYWGDLDSNGFAILHRLRSALPQVESALMDEDVLLAHRDLWVAEPGPARGDLPSLQPREHATLERLRDEGDVRLEQERIPWASALGGLRAALAQR